MKNYLQELGFAKLTEVQQKILNVDVNKNILILSPCGSGKTEAVYNAILNYNRKIIFIQPMRTLASSIYNRIDKYNIQLNLHPWTVQHSTLPQDEFLQNKYCVTTIDQVLTGYLGFGRQSFIRGKNVVLSDLIFDEVQLFEPDKTFLTTINMLKQMIELGNRIIIMTATMPEYLIQFLQQEFDMEVIICEEEAIQDRYIKMQYIEELNFDAINEYQNKQIIICNDQLQQKYIYSEPNMDKNRCIILNNKLTTNDRLKIEKEVMYYFGKDAPQSNKILVTSQIVEAGMDISADKVYSAISPIDNLVQRSGRCSRWGGNGIFTVFHFQDYVYDKEVVKETINCLKQNNNIEFDWEIQKQMVNEVLNPYYSKYINTTTVKKNNINLKNNSRNSLIRDIRNINLIVCANIDIQVEDFNRESVSINIDILKKLQRNAFYTLTKRGIEVVDFYDVEIGDTVLIQGYDCIYDELGFRYKENHRCHSFKAIPTNSANQKIYSDYTVEKWVDHANNVKNLVYKKIKENNIFNYCDEKIENIAFLLGLHDLGKMDIEWQKWAGINENQEPLAHFPFTRKPFTHRNRSHKNISAYILKPHISKIIFNVILQHHKREICINDAIKISKYELHKKYSDVLKSYGYTENLEKTRELATIMPNEILDAGSKDWCEFLYLVGILMESDIDSLI